MEPSDDRPVVDVRGVSKSFGDVRALDTVTFAIRRGQVVALLGANGAGKTTLLTIVSGLRRPDRGSVQVCGHDVATHARTTQRLTSYTPQEIGLYPMNSVYENLSFFGELVGGRHSLAERIRFACEVMDLDGLLGRRANSLSGGEKRRVHTAVGLLSDAPLLLFDEPTAGVDAKTRRQLLNTVRSLADQGRAILYATHYLQEVESLGSKVAILEAGHLMAFSSIAQLSADLGRASVRMLFDSTSTPDVSLQGAVWRADGWLEVAANGDADLARVVAGLGPHASALLAIEVVKPSLETVYLDLTGRRAVADATVVQHD